MLKIVTFLCHPMLHESHWVAEFSLSTFSKCDSKISVFYLHNFEGLSLNMSTLSAHKAGLPGRQRQTFRGAGMVQRGSFPGRGWKSGGYSPLRPPAWLAVQPWARHLVSLDITKSIFGKGRF